MRRDGFLTGKQRWGEQTVASRRGYIVALGKAVIASADVVPESFEELTDPEFLELAAEVLTESNAGDHPSGYVASVLKAARKIAREYLQRPDGDLHRIDDLITHFDPKHRGIAPRNLAKLRRFTPERIDSVLRLSNVIVTDVNAQIAERRKAHKRTHGVLPAPRDVIDSEIARDVMAALAHDILMSRAPRSANVIAARLDWISWQGDQARITVPAREVKSRSAGDADLPILLGAASSRLLRQYLDTIRPRALQEGDAQNPYLFPAQSEKAAPGTPYKTLLKRVTRLLMRHVGVSINPHLYRHLVGWIWLRDSLDNLPKVQTLLGHKSLQTTIDYYAELDETLVMQSWQDSLNGRARA